MDNRKIISSILSISIVTLLSFTSTSFALDMHKLAAGGAAVAKDVKQPLYVDLGSTLGRQSVIDIMPGKVFEMGRARAALAEDEIFVSMKGLTAMTQLMPSKQLTKGPIRYLVILDKGQSKPYFLVGWQSSDKNFKLVARDDIKRIGTIDAPANFDDDFFLDESAGAWVSIAPKFNALIKKDAPENVVAIATTQWNGVTLPVLDAAHALQLTVAGKPLEKIDPEMVVALGKILASPALKPYISALIVADPDGKTYYGARSHLMGISVNGMSKEQRSELFRVVGDLGGLNLIDATAGAVISSPEEVKGELILRVRPIA